VRVKDRQSDASRCDPENQFTIRPSSQAPYSIEEFIQDGFQAMLEKHGQEAG
jgi:hypothetical protein